VLSLARSENYFDHTWLTWALHLSHYTCFSAYTSAFLPYYFAAAVVTSLTRYSVRSLEKT
jgi:hypothetical protein